MEYLGDCLPCRDRMRECRSLPCSRVLESYGLDPTTKSVRFSSTRSSAAFNSATTASASSAKTISSILSFLYRTRIPPPPILCRPDSTAAPVPESPRIGLNMPIAAAPWLCGFLRGHNLLYTHRIRCINEQVMRDQPECSARRHAAPNVRSSGPAKSAWRDIKAAGTLGWKQWTRARWSAPFALP